MASVASAPLLEPQLMNTQLPPLIRTDKDRHFIKAIYMDIRILAEDVSGTNPDQEYIIYKEAFDKIIEYVSAYKPILTSIKAEYENVIETVQRGHREAAFLRRQIQSLTCQPSTLENYARRTEELEERLSQIQSKSASIQEEIQQIRCEVTTRREKLEERKKTPVSLTPQKVVRRNPRPLPGLKPAQMVDKAFLINEVKRLDQVLRTLQKAEETKFIPRETKDELSQSLLTKLLQVDSLREENERTRAREQPLMRAATAARAFLEDPATGQAHYGSLGEAVLRAFKTRAKDLDESQSMSTLKTDSKSDDENEPDDFPGVGRESTIVLDYLEHFANLMKAKKYTRAAQYAANSPRSLLRTMEILHKFKEVDIEDPSQLILLTFCEALISTVPAIRIKLPSDLSFEAVQCALDHDRVDLIEHWITNDRLVLSELCGDLLVTHSSTHPHHAVTCLDLAQFIYEELLIAAQPDTTLGSRSSMPADPDDDSISGEEPKTFRLSNKAVECLVRCGRMRAAMKRAVEARFSAIEYLSLVACYPSAGLVLSVLEQAGEKMWPPLVDQLNGMECLDVLANVLPEWINTSVQKSGAPRSMIIESLLSSTPHLDAQFWIMVMPYCPPSMTYHKEFLTEAIVQDVFRKGLGQASPEPQQNILSPQSPSRTDSPAFELKSPLQDENSV